ncbi:hypothetical protein BX666DRAFT_851826 [Dichotomocladium elegans]|nr:hypothetical protein BX666DRAFT_851826 [Dichotomocladium elegans]
MLTAKIAKSIFASAGNAPISPAASHHLTHITNIFFEQAMDNLASYAKHAGRNSIMDVDAKLLLKRQEVLHDKTCLEALAHQHLPRELWDELCVSATAYNVVYPYKDDDDDDYE